MGPWTRSERIGVMVLLAIVIGVVGFGAVRAGQSAASAGITLRDSFPQVPAVPPVGPTPANSSSPAATSSEQNSTSPPTTAGAPDMAAKEAQEVVVHVAGAVRKPGVYHLRPGARNDDALKAAGGPTKDANTDAVNLAAHIEDGTQLYIPTHKERPDGGASTASAVDTETSSSVPAARSAGKSHSSRSEGKHRGSHGKPGKLTSPEQGQVDLNTASEEELQRLPGVGPAMAARIVAYRQQSGGFHKIDDLLQVSGIGAKKFERLQPFVKVH